MILGLRAWTEYPTDLVTTGAHATGAAVTGLTLNYPLLQGGCSQQRVRSVGNREREYQRGLHLYNIPEMFAGKDRRDLEQPTKESYTASEFSRIHIRMFLVVAVQAQSRRSAADSDQYRLAQKPGF